MTVREIALSLLMEYESSGKYVNLSLASHKTDSLSSSDRGFLTALLYTAVERKITYDYIICALAGRSIGDISPRALNILRLGLCQLLHITSVPDFAAVNETVKLAGSAGERAFVNGVLRAAARQKDALPMPDRKKNVARYLSVAYSFPLPIVKRFVRMLGEDDAERLLAKFNEIPPTTLSVNLNKISRQDFFERLTERGYAPTLSQISPLAVKIDGSANPCDIFGYEDGLFFVQDEASSAAVFALGVKQGDTVVDVCACPGGKSFAAAILASDADVYSYDLHESKLSLVESGARRLGITLKTSARDAREPDTSLIGRANKVICDVPCSGLGVLAKKPDLRHKDGEAAERLPELQLEILTASAKYLKIGGEMIYSTCTLNEAENSDVVHKFLEENKDFTLTDFSVGALSSDGGMLTLWPHLHGTDGFFIAKLKRL